METLTLFLMAVNVLLAVILLDVEAQDEPRRRKLRVEARRQTWRRNSHDTER